MKRWLAAAALAVVALGACGNETLTIKFDVSAGPSQTCPGETCADVPLMCDAVLNVRVIKPSEPQQPYISLCEPIESDRRDLCSIVRVELPVAQMPRETLEVQVMIWPLSSVKYDPETLKYDCREIDGQQTSIGFDIHGFPEEITPSPALGGHAYYHPGDDETLVTLGCSDLAAVNRASCVGSKKLSITASVTDFASPTNPVLPNVATTLDVTVGQPRSTGGTPPVYQMDPADTRKLQRTDLPTSAVASWSAELDDLVLNGAACLEVLQRVGQSTSTVRCRQVSATDTMLDFTGTWLSKSLLDRTLAALEHSLPDEGLTIGVLLDDNGKPAPGFPISNNTNANIAYLSPDGKTVVDGGAQTTTSGLFVSEDAAFGTEFSAVGPQSQPATAIGGRVYGKVTIVVLQFQHVAN